MTEKIKVVKETILEGEIVDGRVTSSGCSAHIPISRKYLGTNIKVLIPDKKTCFLQLPIEDIEYILKHLDDVNLEQKYSQNRKDIIIKSLTEIIHNPEKFSHESIAKVYSFCFDTKNKRIVDILAKIKDAYGL